MQEIMANGSELERMKIFLYMNRGSMKEQQKMVEKITSTCFDQCVTTFSSTHLDSTEKKCLSACVSRQMAANTRLQQRFQEESQKKQGPPPELLDKQ
jgi:hypothetical protein